VVDEAGRLRAQAEIGPNHAEIRPRREWQRLLVQQGGVVEGRLETEDANDAENDLDVQVVVVPGEVW